MFACLGLHSSLLSTRLPFTLSVLKCTSPPPILGICAFVEQHGPLWSRLFCWAAKYFLTWKRSIVFILSPGMTETHLASLFLVLFSQIRGSNHDILPRYSCFFITVIYSLFIRRFQVSLQSFPFFFLWPYFKLDNIPIWTINSNNMCAVCNNGEGGEPIRWSDSYDAHS